MSKKINGSRATFWSRKFHLGSQKGAAFMSILIVSTVIAIILASLIILLRTQMAQSGTIALRQIADQLNLSARDLTIILWERGAIETCIVGVSGGQNVNGVKAKDVTIPNLNSGTVTPYVASTLKFNFCTDLASSTEAECFQSGSPATNQLTTVEFRLENHTNKPADSEDRYTWLLRITTFLKNRNSTKVFKHTADYHTNMRIRKVGFNPENCAG